MKTPEQFPEDRLLRKKEVAALLGCSTRSVEREASCGRLKRIKIRGGVRFRLSEINAIIQSGAS
jgi:excisionase family DNA binding protein